MPNEYQPMAIDRDGKLKFNNMKKILLIALILGSTYTADAISNNLKLNVKNKSIKYFTRNSDNKKITNFNRIFNLHKDHHFVFNNTFIGTYQGCNVYFSGTITFCEDGSYIIQEGSYLDIDCRPRVNIMMARISKDKESIIYSSYLDTKTNQILNIKEAELIDKIILNFFQKL